KSGRRWVDRVDWTDRRRLDKIGVDWRQINQSGLCDKIRELEGECGLAGCSEVWRDTERVT
ncbi:hypothetical protein KI387_043330, partial [Taxus chinensis]